MGTRIDPLTFRDENGVWRRSTTVPPRSTSEEEMSQVLLEDDA
jgi:hypothetical protein